MPSQCSGPSLGVPAVADSKQLGPACCYALVGQLLVEAVQARVLLDPQYIVLCCHSVNGVPRRPPDGQDVQ